MTKVIRVRKPTTWLTPIKPARGRRVGLTGALTITKRNLVGSRLSSTPTQKYRLVGIVEQPKRRKINKSVHAGISRTWRSSSINSGIVLHFTARLHADLARCTDGEVPPGNITRSIVLFTTSPVLASTWCT